MFYYSYLGGSLLISVCLPDVQTRFFEQNQAKTFRMADPHFRLQVSVYEINKIIHGRLGIWIKLNTQR